MKRIFVQVSRGMTDKTAVCVFPWEMAILSQIHGGDVEEVSIDSMCALKGAVKVQKNTYKRAYGTDGDPPPEVAPSLRKQLEAMAHVPDDESPVADPESEYGRLADKYGFDKEMPIPVVTRVYGEFMSGAFTAALKQAAESQVDQPSSKPDKPIAEMSINEVRAELSKHGIDYEKTATKAELVDQLEMATV